MEIEDVVNKKRDLEVAIRDLINEFHEETGHSLYVTGIDVETLAYLERKKSVAWVCVSMEVV